MIRLDRINADLQRMLVSDFIVRRSENVDPDFDFVPMSNPTCSFVQRWRPPSMVSAEDRPPKPRFFGIVRVVGMIQTAGSSCLNSRSFRENCRQRFFEIMS